MDSGQTAATVVTLGVIGVMMWAELPPWQREQIKRVARHRLYRILHRLARHAGHQAMGRELAGKPEAEAGYELPLWISNLRDRV